MDYVYKISRKNKRVGFGVGGTVRIFKAEYVYKPWGEYGFDGDEGRKANNRIFSRKVGPTKRAWDRSGEVAQGQLFVHDFEAGEAVYEFRLPNAVSFRDETGEGRAYKWVGKLIETATGLKFAPTVATELRSSI